MGQTSVEQSPLGAMLIKPIHLFILSILLANCLPSHAALPADQAFALQINTSPPHQVTLHWDLQPGYLLYQKSIQIVTDPITTTHYQLPTAKHQHDQPASYQQQLTIPVNLPKPPAQFTLKVSYQGCLGQQLCYPPVTKTWPLHHKEGRITLAEETASHAFPLKTVSFFGLGLLLSMTPCVLPMLPISCSLILGRQCQTTTKRALGLSLFYVLSMALTYAVAGVLAASVGITLQSQLQQPVLLWGFAALCGLMGISMLHDRFKLALPRAWQDSLAKRCPTSSTNPYLRVVIMGILCTLMLSPCVSAPLITALSYISLHHAPWAGGSLLFAMGIGMGVPIIVVNTLGRHYLPRNGAWTQALQTIMGIAMGALGLWLLRNQLSPSWLWLLGGLWLGHGLWRLGSPWQSKPKRITGIATMMVLYTTMAWWQLERPWYGDDLHRVTTQTVPEQTTVYSSNALDMTLKRHQEQAVLIDFVADWCTACQELDHMLAKHSKLNHAIKIIKVDISQQDSHSKALQKAYQVYAPPSLILLSAKDHNMVQRFDGKPSDTQLKAALITLTKTG